jgi:uncharacterized protein (TIGR02145 family)
LLAQGGINQSQGNCPFTQPPAVGTFATFNPAYSASTFVTLTDERDNKNYAVAKIGGFWVMTQNLNYQEGLTFNAEPGVANGVAFTSTTNGAPAIGSFWCPGSGTVTSNLTSCEAWGALYTWETAMMPDGKGTWEEGPKDWCPDACNSEQCRRNWGRNSTSGTLTEGRGICPANWHVPADYEWGIIFDNMESVTSTAHSDDVTTVGDWYGTDAGKRAKATCTGTATDADVFWNSGTGIDAYGFRALPAGIRQTDGTYVDRGTRTIFWSSSPSSSANARFRVILATQARVNRNTNSRARGQAVRCVQQAQVYDGNCEGDCNLTLCEGQSFALTSTAEGQEPITYKWYDVTDPAASVTVGANAATLTVAGKTAGTYAYLCEVANAACTLSTDSYTVQVVTPPAPPTLTKTDNTCVGTAITFTAAGGSGTYEWNCTGFTCSGDGATQTTPTDAGNYTASVRSVTITNGTPCFSEYTAIETGAITAPATNGQVAGACGCADGTIDCSGTCKTNSNYPTNDGICTGACTQRAYVQLREPCGTVLYDQYSTYANPDCYAANYTARNRCTGTCAEAYYDTIDGCTGQVISSSTTRNWTCSSGCSYYNHMASASSCSKLDRTVCMTGDYECSVVCAYYGYYYWINNTGCGSCSVGSKSCGCCDTNPC